MKQMKWMAWLLLVLAVISLPMLVINILGDGYAEEGFFVLARTTVGSLGDTLNSTTVRLPCHDLDRRYRGNNFCTLEKNPTVAEHVPFRCIP